MPRTKNIKTHILTASLAVLAASGSAVAEPIRISPEMARHLQQKRIIQPKDLDRRINLPRRPDLAVTNVSLHPSAPRAGRSMVQLRVTVKNVGLADWRSAPGQQNVMAYAGSQAFLVSVNIKSLDAGASRSFAIEMPKLWATGLEFPPDLRVMIVFDPDIRLDGNAANDDANASNNSRIIRGLDANDMVGR